MTTSAKPRVSIHTPRWDETTKREFDAIGRRAAALSSKASSELFDKDGNVIDPTWAKILADLDSWARTHKIELSTSERESKSIKPSTVGGNPVPMRGDCPSKTTSTETIEYWGSGQRVKIKHTCYLHRQTLLGRCVYNCSSEQL